MDNKKTKLTISGSAKKSIKNIEIAKTKGKNSVLIDKQQNKFSNKPQTSKPKGLKTRPFGVSGKSNFPKGNFPQVSNDFKTRKFRKFKTY